MTPEERAYALLKKLKPCIVSVVGGGMLDPEETLPVLAQAIRDAEATGRREGLGEAAALCRRQSKLYQNDRANCDWQIRSTLEDTAQLIEESEKVSDG